MSLSGIPELKETCNKIVGKWYCDEIKQTLIFSLNDKLLKESKVTIINNNNKGEPFQADYGVAIDISRGIELDQHNFYFDIGQFEKRYYSIITLTKDMLIIEEFFMGSDKRLPRLIYKRDIDLNAADDILKAID